MTAIGLALRRATPAVSARRFRPRPSQAGSASGSCRSSPTSRSAINGEPVERSGKAIDFYRVEQTDGPSLLLKAETQGLSGWAKASDVVPVEQAIDFFTQQIRAHPGDAFPHAMRAFLWREKKEFDNALARLRRGHPSSNPRTPPYYCSRGFDRHSKKEYDKAIADFDQAIRLDPKYTLAYIGRGISRASTQGDTPRPSPTSARPSGSIRCRSPLTYNRGLAWQSKKEYAKAVIDYNLAIRLDPQHALAHCQRGKRLGGPETSTTRRSPISTRRSGSIRDCPMRTPAGPGLLATCPDARVRDGNKAVAIGDQSV